MVLYVCVRNEMERSGVERNGVEMQPTTTAYICEWSTKSCSYDRAKRPEGLAYVHGAACVIAYICYRSLGLHTALLCASMVYKRIKLRNNYGAQM